MSETKHISEMAERVANNLFSIFKWKRKIASDFSWDCVSPDEHGGKKIIRLIAFFITEIPMIMKLNILILILRVMRKAQ